jgi:WD40 repeat protein
VAVALSADGSELAGASGKTVHVRDVFSGGDVARLDHWSNVGAVAFSPDGYHLASASPARVWDLQTGREAARLRPDQVRAVAFHPHGHQLATAGASGQAVVWEPDSALT